MEIDEFIEQDILIYLDDALDRQRATTAPTRMQPTPSTVFTRDYEKELFASLDKQNLTEAKNILHDLKRQFDECPNGTPDKEQLKALLITLYDKFKEHIDAQSTFERLDAKLQGKTEPSAAPSSALMAEPAAPQSPRKEASAQATPEPVATPKESSASDLLDKAKGLAASGDLEAAVRTYKEAKRAAGTAPTQEMVERFKAVFESIKFEMAQTAARKGLHAAPKQQPEEPKELPKAFTPKEMDQQSLLQLEREKLKLDAMIKRNDISASMEQYRRMRLMAQQLSDPRVARQAQRKLQRIYDILDDLSKHAAHNERKLMAVP